MSEFERYGIVGSGPFGRFMVDRLIPPRADVLVYDHDDRAQISDRARQSTLEEVLASDVVALAVPFDSYEPVLIQFQEHARPDTALLEVGSVKVAPETLFQRMGLLDRGNLAMVHPLFGPQSVRKPRQLRDKATIVTYPPNTEPLDGLIEYWEKDLRINIWSITANEHDRHMAKVHGLSFFIGEALDVMNLTAVPELLRTPFYRRLIELAEAERFHSEALVRTVQRHNPYVAEIRSEFLTHLYRLHAGFSVDTDISEFRPLVEPPEIIGNIRPQIDAIDKAWVALMGLRFMLTDRVGIAKVAAGLPLVDEQREGQQIEMLIHEALTVGAPDNLVRAINRAVHKLSVHRMLRLQHDVDEIEHVTSA